MLQHFVAVDPISNWPGPGGTVVNTTAAGARGIVLACAMAAGEMS